MESTMRALVFRCPCEPYPQLRVVEVCAKQPKSFAKLRRFDGVNASKARCCCIMLCRMVVALLCNATALRVSVCVGMHVCGL